MKACIAIKDDVLIKTGDPQLLRTEVAKNKCAYNIAEQTKLFKVPKVLDFNVARAQVEFEFIPGLKSIRDIVISEEMAKPLMRRIGLALAAIHKNLKLPDDMLVPLPQSYDMTGTEVFLHGDYGFANIYVGSNDERIIILDWQATRKVDVPATYGSRYFDLMCFIYNIFYRPLGRKRYKMTVPAAPMALEFLRGYFEKSDFPYDRAQLQSYMKQFLNARKTDRKSRGGFKRRLILIPSHLKLRSFIKTFDLNSAKSEE
jgi:hypothetical protein